MKTILASTLLLTAISLAPAQTIIPTPPGAPATQARIAEIGENHRVWSWSTTEPSALGDTRIIAHQFTELSTGLYYRGPDGALLESSELIESFPGGAVARQGQHKVIFGKNLATPGAIDLELPGGQRLRSHLLMISYFDVASGRSVCLAQVQDAEGIVSGNQVIYENAFDGLLATVRYTYFKSGFEQDVLFLSPPEAVPEDFGLDSRTTVLQILTEFLDPPQPEKRTDWVPRANGELQADERLIFGGSQIGRGKAFTLGAGAEGRPVFTRKRWQKLDGRDFLIEEVPLPDVLDGLRRLPEGGSLPRSNRVWRTASLKPLLPPAPRSAAPANPQPMLLARWTPPARAYVVDYQLLTGTTNAFTFSGTNTYYISSVVNLNGDTTIQAGAVIKVTNSYPAAAYLQFNGTLTCQTGPGSPALITSLHDDTVGESLPWSTGNPVGRRGYVGLALNGAFTLQNLHFNHLWVPVSVWSSVVAEDVQFVNCDCAFDVWGGAVTVRNALFANVDNLLINSVSSPVYRGEHWTADKFNALLSVKDGTQANSLNLTNCLFTRGTNWVVGTNSPTINSNTVTWLASDAGVYQAAGAGSFYLADASPYRDAGITNLSAAAQALISARTTYPPLVLSNTAITADTSFTPQAPRDLGTPDQGYHYAPLDYCVSSVTVSNACVSLATGVAVGVFGTNGFTLGTNARLVSAGSPLAMNRLVRYRSVQEQPTAWGPAGSTASLFDHTAGSVDVTLRFTELAFLADPQEARYVFRRDGSLPANLRCTDCAWRGGYYYQSIGPGSTTQTVGLTNNLFENATLDFYAGVASAMPSIVTLQNNLLAAGSLSFRSPQNPNGAWRAYDNLFDGVTLVKTGAVAAVSHGYNGYRGVAAWGGTGDVTLTTADYQTGSLGSYYYPTNGASGGLTNLLNAGSTWATNVGLYHFTTTTNQVKEAATKVDIGFHRVAVDANGNPVDTDGDGIPDYLEDANGDGSASGDATSWLQYNSPNGLTGSSSLQLFTPLHK